MTFHVHPTECLIRRLASFCAFSRAHGYSGEEGHCAVWPPSVEPARREVSYDIPPNLLVALPACLQVMHVRASRSSKTGPVFLRCIRLPEKQIAVGKAMGTSESNPPMRGLLRCRRGRSGALSFCIYSRGCIQILGHTVVRTSSCLGYVVETCVTTLTGPSIKDPSR